MVGEEKITVELANETLESALKACLRGTNLGFKIEEKHVIISPKLRKVEGNQNVKIYEGTVIDNNGEVLPGVTIVLKGTKQGVSTDTNGNFGDSRTGLSG